MSGVKVLAFAMIIAGQSFSQNTSPTFPHSVPPKWGSSSAALFTAGQAPWQYASPWPDARLMFPYSVPQEEGSDRLSLDTQCRFSDGKTITVSYSTQHVKFKSELPPYLEFPRTVFNRDIKFATDDSFVTVKGITVPAGDYTISAVPLYGKRGGWTLFMSEHNGAELRLPMSVSKLPSPADKSIISFDHTGGSCTMHVNWKNENTQVSVEFRERNPDLPLEN